jgi:hypothetical protein
MLESFIRGVEAADEAVPATVQGPKIALAWQTWCSSARIGEDSRLAWLSFWGRALTSQAIAPYSTK